MTSFTQAIIPNAGEETKASHLASLAEAFNSRILQGAGDAHWRIPYGIFSSLFYKPRVDDFLKSAPESEFFDFYQFVNPANDEIWPSTNPNEPEGLNIQNNVLNRFILGMNFKLKDPNSGEWLYEREDVRASILQQNIRTNNANGFNFFGSNIIGGSSAGGNKYTAFGFSREVHSKGYLNSSKAVPGNYYGGYFGTLPGVMVAEDGCGILEGSNTPLPLTRVSFFENKRFDANSTQTHNIQSYDVCPLGKTNDTVGPASILNVGGNYLIAKGDDIKAAFPSPSWHLDQNRSYVYLTREVNNQLLRVLYFYTTHAIGFDFDWFFNNQYAYAPELGAFQNLTYSYVGQTENQIFREVLDVNFYHVRLNFTANYSDNELNGQNYISPPNVNYQNIDPSATISSMKFGETETALQVTGAGNVLNFLKAKRYMDPNISVANLYEYGSVGELANSLRIPPGFVFQRFLISKSSTGNQVKIDSFDLQIEIIDNEGSGAYALDYKISGDETSRIVLTDGRSLNINYSFINGDKAANNYVKFKISNVIYKETYSNDLLNSFNITITPIFLMEYKPKIEDAYALLRGCCYFGDADAKFDSYGHPFSLLSASDNKTFCQRLSDDLKKYGYVTDENIAKPGSDHLAADPSVNTNGVFEAARRASLYVRMLRGGQNFLGYSNTDGKAKLIFSRYAYSGDAEKTNQSTRLETTNSEFSLIKRSSYKQVLNKDEIQLSNLPTYYDAVVYAISKDSSKNFTSQQEVDLDGIESVVKSDSDIALGNVYFSAFYDCIYTYAGSIYLLQFEDGLGERFHDGDGYFYKKYTNGIDESYEKVYYNFLDNERVGIGALSSTGITNIYALTRTPNPACISTVLGNSAGQVVYCHINKNSDFIYNASTSFIDCNYKSEAPTKVNNQFIPYPSLSISIANKTDILNLSLEDQLFSLYTALYTHYSSASIFDASQPTDTFPSLQYKDGGTLDLQQSLDVSSYNKYLSGYKIKIELSIDPAVPPVKNPPLIRLNHTFGGGQQSIKDYALSFDSSQNVCKTINEIELPFFYNDSSLTISIIDIDGYLPNQKGFNMRIYIINSLIDEQNNFTPINRDVGIYFETTYNVFQDNLPKARDMFQGITGQTRDANGNIIEQGINGIINKADINNPLTNEWIMWINFLPYKNNISSPFKPETYARVLNPFIDRCHLNSGAIPRSLENTHVNLGLKDAFAPFAPPSYRYMPLMINRNRLNFENIIGDILTSDRDNFYNSCKANVKPYKVTSAKVLDDGTVEIILDRPLDGFGKGNNYRTDHNGISGWLGEAGANTFLTGDASMTNANGYNAFSTGSGQANGYTGSFYPIFMFVKLIPKPILDGNNLYQSTDSRLTIDPIKQAEWYLDIMREGFTYETELLGPRCSYSGYQTPPDYSYQSLLYTANKNNVIPLNDFIFRETDSLFSFNPRGFGAIPFNGSYRDHYGSIAKGVNELTHFRVPYPSDFKIKDDVYEGAAVTPSSSTCGIFTESANSPTTLIGSGEFDLRKADGSLMGISTGISAGYSTDLKKIVSGKTETSLKISFSKSLKDFAYANIPLPLNASPITANLTKSSINTYLTEDVPEGGLNETNIFECSTNNKTYYYTIKRTEESSCTKIYGNVSLAPTDTPRLNGQFYVETINSRSESSYTNSMEFHESGFVICSPGVETYSQGT